MPSALMRRVEATPRKRTHKASQPSPLRSMMTATTESWGQATIGDANDTIARRLGGGLELDGVEA